MRDWMKMAGIHSSEITDQGLFERRRRFLQASAAAGVIGLIAVPGAAQAAKEGVALPGPIIKSPFSTDEELSSLETVTTYNNFYELGTDKGDPARNADKLKTEPWSVTVDGECDNPGVFTLEDIMKPHAIEERIYRMRCVEAWSMVIPWNGFALADLIKRMKPNSKAKYVAFETVVQDDLPGIRRGVLDFPYREGLRIDEAMNPLTMVSIGLYGEELLGQSGAPLRLVVPWKYGYKSIKSIVRISFVEEQPDTSWNMSAPREYGFYSNVNPERSHPRWSQAKERRLSGDTGGLSALFASKSKTQFMNGYAEQVASLYDGMDLQENH
ncbi:protein-methionine-sulfoxide reductase catalytic subunit MsrP [Granulosicoccus sp.]|nr:protein-methionine-sulfoxide reductase catalytic subunit MsrP [Granulosicoccus sp.]MDB4222341.1 protein-methionine-sulfoxide reductase catalytic subunit MsrP [Granulosicoccus sp.]